MTISSVGTSSRTYSTTAAFLAACPANLVTAADVWKGEYYNDSEFLISSGDVVNISGITTDSTHYVWMKAAAGQSFRDNGGAATLPLRYDQSKGVGLRGTDTYGNLVRATIGIDVVIENLMLYHDNTSSHTSTSTLYGDKIVWKGCIVESRRTNHFSDPNAPGTFINCALVQRGSSFSDTLLPSSAKAYNCTLVRPSDLSAGTKAFGAYYGSYPLVKNCAVFGFTTPFADTLASYQSGTGYNASAVASGSMPGSNNQASLTFGSQFTNVTDSTRDWRILNTGALYNNGTRDQTNTADLDIIGAARSTTTPSIGAREYAAAAAASHSIGIGMSMGAF